MLGMCLKRVREESLVAGSVGKQDWFVFISTRQPMSQQIIHSHFLPNPEQSPLLQPHSSHKHTSSPLSLQRQHIERQLLNIIAKVEQYQTHKRHTSHNDSLPSLTPTNPQQKRQRLTTSSRLKSSRVIESQSRSYLEMVAERQTSQPKRILKKVKSGKIRTNTRLNSIRLKQVKSIFDISRLSTVPERPKYINYLPQVDFRAPLSNKKLSPEGRKERLISHLREAQQLDQEALKRINDIKRRNKSLKYEEYLEMEHKVDGLFIQALKIRLSCAERM